MADEPRTKDQLTDEELESQEAEELPDRETMMILEPDPGVFPLPADVEPASAPEAPDDRYEQ